MAPHTLASASYGKDLVRILRVVREPSDPSCHRIAEYTVRCLLSGPSLVPSYTEADNSPVVATDSIKNTLNLLAKTLPGDTVLCPEKYVLHVMEHFLRRYAHIDGVEVDLIQHRWSRIALDADCRRRPLSSLQPHKHSFIRDGNDVRTVRAYASRDGASRHGVVRYLKGGIKDLVVLKSFRQRILRVFARRIHNAARGAGPHLQHGRRLRVCLFVASGQAHRRTAPSASQIAARLLRCLVARRGTRYPHLCNTLEPQRPGHALQDGRAHPRRRRLPGRHRRRAHDAKSSLHPNRPQVAGVENLKEDQAEVFLPTAHPSGLIRAKIARGDGGSKAKL
ncbi:hypothetical protein L7F22_053464 [Adiantum nelumboides]|nr:hypothetical protein [Adiantum nelumboides]